MFNQSDCWLFKPGRFIIKLLIFYSALGSSLLTGLTFSRVGQEDEEQDDDDEDVDQGQVLQLVLVLAGRPRTRLRGVGGGPVDQRADEFLDKMLGQRTAKLRPKYLLLLLVIPSIPSFAGIG